MEVRTSVMDTRNTSVPVILLMWWQILCPDAGRASSGPVFLKCGPPNSNYEASNMT